MSQTPRHIKTDRSLNRPTDRRAEKAPASRPVQPAQPDFFAEESPPPQSLPAAQAAAAAQNLPAVRPLRAAMSLPAAAKRRKRPRSGSRWS